MIRTAILSLCLMIGSSIAIAAGTQKEASGDSIALTEASGLAREAAARWRECQHDSALPLLQRGLGILESVYGPYDGRLLLFLNNIADTNRMLSRFEEALVFSRRALQVAQANPQTSDNVLYILNSNAGYVHEALRQFDLANQLFSKALAIAERAYGPASVEAASSL